MVDWDTVQSISYTQSAESPQQHLQQTPPSAEGFAEEAIAEKISGSAYLKRG